MNRIATLSRSEFTLLGRNRLLLFNAIVLPLIFPVGMLYLSRDGGLSDKSVSAGLEVFALFLLVFVVFYNLLSVYATRRDELVLKRLRTGECSDAEILAGPAVPSWVLTGLLTVVIGIAVMVLGGSAPVNPVLVLVAVIGGAALFTALGVDHFGCHAKCRGGADHLHADSDSGDGRYVLDQECRAGQRCSHSRFHSAGRSSGPSQSRMAGADHWRTG